MLKQKGLSFGLQEMIAMVLVIISFIFLIQFMTQSKSGLDTKLSAFCEKNPESFLCDGKATTLNVGDKIALKSTEGLACAISSVAAGTEQTCLDEFAKKQSSGQKIEDNTQNSKPNTFKPPTIECAKTYGSIASLSSPMWVTSCTLKNFNLPQQLQEYDIPITPDKSLKTDFGWIGVAGDPKYVVYSEIFPLGGDAAWAGQSAWYQGFGNVMFLSFCATHFIAPVLKAVIAPLRTAKNTASALAQTAGKIKNAKLFKGASENLAANGGRAAVTAEKLVASEAKDLTKAYANLQANGAIAEKYGVVNSFLAHADPAKVEAANEAGINLVQAFRLAKEGKPTLDLVKYLPEQEATDLVAKMVGDSAIKQKLAQLFTPSKSGSALRFGAYTGIDSAASYYLARIDSEFGKFEKIYPSSLVLQNSMVADNLRNQFKLGRLKKDVDSKEYGIEELGIPVILDREGRLTNVAGFSLASPCKTDLEITKGVTGCSIYAYDMEKRVTKCEDPKDKTYLDSLSNRITVTPTVECGQLPTDQTDAGTSTEAKSLIKKLLDREHEIIEKIGELQIFKDTDGDGKNDVAIDPITGVEFYYDKISNSIVRYKGGTTFGDVGDNKIVGAEKNDIQGKHYFHNECKPLNIQVAGIYNDAEADKIRADNYEQSWENALNLGFDGGKTLCYGEPQPGKPIITRDAETSFVLGLRTYFNIYPSIRMSLNENGEQIMKSIVILARVENPIRVGGDSMYIVMTDRDGDGKLDYLSHNLISEWVSPPDTLSYPKSLASVIYQNSGRGQANSIVATNCNTEVLRVLPKNQDSYKTEGSGYNFCYQEDKEGAISVAATSLAFGVSAVSKSTGVGWILGTAVDCGLAYYQIKYSKTEWPGKKY